MVAKCSAGNWVASCEVGCYCVVNAKDPDDCFCEPVPQPANMRGKKLEIYTKRRKRDSI